MIKLFFVLVICIFTFSINNSDAKEDLIINEICASNSSVLYDEESETPDWFEIYNNTSQMKYLSNYFISESKDFSKALRLPSRTIAKNEYTYIIAGEQESPYKDMFMIEGGGYGIYTYMVMDSYAFAWIELKGDFEIRTRIHSLLNPGFYGRAGLIARNSLDTSDKFYGVFLPNQERRNYVFSWKDSIGKAPTDLYTEREIMNPENYFSLKRRNDTLIACILDRDGFCLEQKIFDVDSITSMQVGIAVSACKLDQIARASFSDLVINGKSFDYKHLNFRNFHTNNPSKIYKLENNRVDFKLSKDSGTLYLWDSNKKIIDSISWKEQKADISFGRFPDASNKFMYLATPSPAAVNFNPKLDYCSKVIYEPKSGVYTDTQRVVLKSATANTKIYYTLNGDTPSEKSFLYNDTLIISQNIMIRAIALADSMISSEYSAATYIFNEDTKLPIVSVGIDSMDLYNPVRGLYTDIFGENPKPMHFQYFDESKSIKLDQLTETKLHGNVAALVQGQKAHRVLAKSKYGESVLKFPIFGNKGLDSYDKLLLRNSGNDWRGLYIRDIFATQMTNTISSLMNIAFKQSLLYFNGNYWGIIDLKERLDEEYLSMKYNLPKFSISYAEDDMHLIFGEIDSYRNLLNSSKDSTLPITEFLNMADSTLDLQNFIDYYVISIFAHNHDWFGNNIKFWKSKSLDNKWRFILYDFDRAFGLEHERSYESSFINDILYHKNSNNLKLHNHIIFNRLLDDQSFKTRFIIRACDLLNGKLSPKITIPLLNSMLDKIEPEVARHQAKWKESIPNWYIEADFMREFLEKRQMKMLEQFRDNLGLDSIIKIKISSNLNEKVSFKINSVDIKDTVWEGYYFKNMPIDISVKPDAKQKFLGWNKNYGSNLNFELKPDSNLTITAIFEDDEKYDVPNLLINEIMNKPSVNKDTKDWVELYNFSGKDIDISGWWLIDNDSKHSKFIFPNNTIFKNGEYIIVCENIELFKTHFPNVKNVYGNMSFGLGAAGDAVALYDDLYHLIDSVAYFNIFPWPPTDVSTEGKSIELNSFLADNSEGENWHIAYGDIDATPGEFNTILTSVRFERLENVIYPNPAKKDVTISFDDISSFESMQIYDENIKFITNVDILGRSEIPFSVENLANGTYSLFFRNEKKVYIAKLVIEK